MTFASIVIITLSILAIITKCLSILCYTLFYILYNSIRFVSLYAFAFSPIPSYLPQFLSLQQFQREQQQRRRKRIHIKKNNNDDFDNDDMCASICYDHDILQEDPQKTQQQQPQHDHEHKRNKGSTSNNNDNKNDNDVGGMSLYSIYILLLSHLLRLLYFFNLFHNKNNNNNDDTPPYDLVVQSVIMVMIQFLLCYTMQSIQMEQKIRNYHHHRHHLLLPKCDNKKELSFSHDSLLVSHQHPPSSLSPRNKFSYKQIQKNLLIFGFFSFVCIHFRVFSSFSSSSSASSSSLSSQQSSSYNYGDDKYQEQQQQQLQSLLLQFSIFLESNLALPQCIRNYRNNHTKNLSLIMICNWMLGDLFKVGYFLFFMPSSSLSSEEGPSSSSSNDRLFFACGSMYSFFMDVIVWMQCVFWYPNVEAIEWRDWMERNIGEMQQRYNRWWMMRRKIRRIKGRNGASNNMVGGGGGGGDKNEEEKQRKSQQKNKSSSRGSDRSNVVLRSFVALLGKNKS